MGDYYKIQGKKDNIKTLELHNFRFKDYFPPNLETLIIDGASFIKPLPVNLKELQLIKSSGRIELPVNLKSLTIDGDSRFHIIPDLPDKLEHLTVKRVRSFDKQLPSSLRTLILRDVFFLFDKHHQ